MADLLQHLSRITRLRVRHTETGAPCFWEEIITGPLEYIRGPRNRLTQVLEPNQRGRPLLRHLQHALRAAPGSRPRPRGSELAAWAAAEGSMRAPHCPAAAQGRMASPPPAYRPAAVSARHRHTALCTACTFDRPASSAGAAGVPRPRSARRLTRDGRIPAALHVSRFEPSHHDMRAAVITPHQMLGRGLKVTTSGAHWCRPRPQKRQRGPRARVYCSDSRPMAGGWGRAPCRACVRHNTTGPSR